MTTDQVITAEQSPTRPQRRRILRRALARSLASTIFLVALYCLAPMDKLSGVPLWLSLSAGLVILVLVILLQVRRITRSRYPGLQAVEALAVTAPLFLLLFASAYLVLAQADPANFSTPQLNRTDTLYFTLTVFSTVGFGDITASSQTARVIVMIQMVLDLVVLGLGVQAYRDAVNVGRQRSGTASTDQPQENPKSGKAGGSAP